jgi:hypothetical protein
MPLPVSLREVAEEMMMGGDEWEAYINPKTGEFVSFPAVGSLHFKKEDDGFAEAREKVEGSDDFIALPDKFEIDEYDIMKQFCRSQDGELGDRLLDAIAGKGAFWRFYDLVSRQGIAQDWYRFRDEALAKVAARFLNANGIPYIEDAAR